MKKLKILLVCFSVLFIFFGFSGCKSPDLNYPEIWYINISLNGGKYAEGNPYDYSANTNVMKAVSKTNFENFSMPEAKYLTAPEGKVFAGWYFDNNQEDFSFNWTEENWLKACNNATLMEEGKRSVWAYAKWVDQGEAVFAFNGGKYGAFKSTFTGSERYKKINLSNFDGAMQLLGTLNIDSVFNYPVSKSFNGWYLHVAKNVLETDVELNIGNVNDQIANDKSAYFELVAKWDDREVIYFELDTTSNLPFDLKDAVRFTDDFFDTRIKDIGISFTNIPQTEKRMIVFVYVDALSSLSDLSGIMPSMQDVVCGEGFDRTFSGLYFYAYDGEKDVRKELTVDNLLEHVSNRQVEITEDYLYVYLDWDQKITFDYNYEGAPASTVVTAKVGDTLLPPSLPTREGYTFIGWSTENWDSSTMYYGWDFSARTVVSDITLYAVWEQNPT